MASISFFRAARLPSTKDNVGPASQDFISSRSHGCYPMDWPGVPAFIKEAVQILKLGTNLDLQEDGNKCHRGEGRTLSNDWRRPKEFEAAKIAAGQTGIVR